MSLIDEIHSQKPFIRYTLFGLSAFTVISFVGFFGFRAIQKDMFMALHDDPKEQQEFLAQRDQGIPQPLAFIGKGLGSLTASIGGLLGFDRSKGFDRSAQDDTVYLLPLSK